MVESQRIPGVDLRAAEPQVIRIMVKTPWQKEEFLVHREMLVREFKEHVARHFSSSPDQIVLVYVGRILKDHKTLGQHGIHLDYDATVYVVVRSPRGRPSRQASASPTSPAPDQKPPRGGAFASDGLRELTASLGLNTANFSEFQSQLMSNPDMMVQLLENPFIQSKLSSPDLMKELVTSNPQVRQVMEKAPEISHVFSSPEGMRLVVELARNPAVVREFIKSPPQATTCPGSVPGGDNNSVLQGAFPEAQRGLGQKAIPKRCAPSPLPGSLGGHPPTFDHGERLERARERLPSPRPWPPKPGTQHPAPNGNDQSNGESGAVRGEAGQLASATVRNLLHQIIKHLMQNLASSSPSRSSHTPEVVAKMVRRNTSVSRSSRGQAAPQVPDLLQQIQSTDILLANWSPKEIQGLVEIQQRLQALATDEPATERRGRPERPARRAHSITSLCDVLPPVSRVGRQDVTAQQILETLVGADFLAGVKTASRLRGSSAQPSSKQKRTYKL
ncbi:ubiquilin-1-like [Lacerta agilis]|uniref:ubiquilin-1-like n=1 Tax=Lacerta agilis TaxID=80427 RepID=UPI0014196BDE|nr:ubiquilin-1-like [Lacerta agilis]